MAEGWVARRIVRTHGSGRKAGLQGGRVVRKEGLGGREILGKQGEVLEGQEEVGEAGWEVGRQVREAGWGGRDGGLVVGREEVWETKGRIRRQGGRRGVREAGKQDWETRSEV
jgi:hypothetical protein